jgi:hypothetical protein
MSGTPYNGYSWKQREAILKAYKRGDAGPGFSFAGKPCGLCGDPDRPAGEWHSEDYSPPFSFNPPATWPICKACHGRLHKRFNKPAAEWALFRRHVEAGGYGREFAACYPPRHRAALCEAIARGEVVAAPALRPRADGSDWWQGLTLDPESLEAPWARPRPWRPRPDPEGYRRAIAAASPTDKERAILRFHAAAARRTVTMRSVAKDVLGSDRAAAANLAYGRLAHRIGEQIDWAPDRRADGSPFWMSVIAEGWQPPSTRAKPREYELVMVPSLASALAAIGDD